MNNELITIGDISIPLSRFVDMIATRIAAKIADKSKPVLLTQNKCYKLYGRRNVENWKATGELPVISTSTGRRYIRSSDIETVASHHPGYTY